jgi:hypothetical protein
METIKPFSGYSDSELLTLTNENLNDAIRLEAIERGVAPPITLSEALRRSEWRGYEKPAEAIKVFRLRQSYSASDFGWLDEAKALAALEGAVKIEKVRYGDDDLKITTSELSVETVWVGVSKATHKAVKFTEYFEDNKPFEAIRDECVERYGKVHQDAYDARVRAQKRAEYLRLARGDEAIAKAFWDKAERTQWPTEGGAL